MLVLLDMAEVERSINSSEASIREAISTRDASSSDFRVAFSAVVAERVA